MAFPVGTPEYVLTPQSVPKLYESRAALKGADICWLDGKFLELNADLSKAS